MLYFSFQSIKDSILSWLPDFDYEFFDRKTKKSDEEIFRENNQSFDRFLEEKNPL